MDDESHSIGSIILSILLIGYLAIFSFETIKVNLDTYYQYQVYQYESKVWKSLRDLNKIKSYLVPGFVSYNRDLIKKRQAVIKVIEILEQEKLNHQHILRGLQISWLESKFNPEAINVNKDGTRDIGWWQINDVNNLSEEQRKDLEFSTRWAAPRLKTNPYIWAVYKK